MASSPAGGSRGAIGRTLALVRRSLDSGAKVIYVTLGGWDTHTNQPQRHARLLNQVGQGLAALYRDLNASGRDRQVLTLVWSEFGRRPAQNGARGTDHGTAGSAMLLGPVNPGFHGGDPALASLMADNLPVQVDFRSIYAEILQHWLGTNPALVLGESFSELNVLA